MPQDPASYEVVTGLGDVSGKQVLDLCAGRGVKATGLADLGAEVLAVDVDRSRLEQAAELATLLGLDEKIRLRTADGMDPSAFEKDRGRFDVVLVDAPCTGLGTLRRRPEIAWRRRPEDVSRMVSIQRALMRTAVDLVAPGGTLLYAVCTFAAAEADPVESSEMMGNFQEIIQNGPRRPTEGVDAFQTRRWVRHR